MSRQTRSRVTREQLAELEVNRREHGDSTPLVDAEARAWVLAQALVWLREADAEGESEGDELPS